MAIYERKINFVGYRRLWYLLSLIIIISGLIYLTLHGLNLGIDFTGGNLLQIRLAETADIGQVRAVLEEQGLGQKVQEAGANEFIIRTRELTEDENARLLALLEEKLGATEILRNEKVGAVIGEELTRNAYLALAIASVLMVIYITVRFEFWFALAAIIALLHDVLITLGFFSLTQWEIDSTFVAAMLTVVGYSINDTIVVFDRIRENLKGARKERLEDIANASISQTVVRSINTSLTVIMALVALIVLGGATTKLFATAMLIGTITGTYSSIFIATPLWIDFNHLQGRKTAGRQVLARAR